MENGNAIGRTEVKNKLIAYMENKYNDSFTYVDSFDGGFDSSHVRIIVSPSRHPELEVGVGYDLLEDGERFVDNYMQVLYEEETKARLKEALEAFFAKDVVVTYAASSSGTENGFGDKTTLDEFLESDASGIFFYAVVSHEYDLGDKDGLTASLKQTLKASFGSFEGDIYFAKTAEDMRTVAELSVWRLDELERIKVKND